MASLQGRVTEYYTGRSVSGVLIILGSLRAVTDANGYFTLTNMPSGSYTLQVIHRDFQPYSFAAQLPEDQAYTMPDPIRIMSLVRAL